MSGDQAIQAIIEIYQKNDPEDAGFYTPEWVQEGCSEFNLSPEEMLASLLESEARAAARKPVVADQPGTADLPAHYVEKLSGAIDGFSADLVDGKPASAGISS